MRLGRTPLSPARGAGLSADGRQAPHADDERKARRSAVPSPGGRSAVVRDAASATACGSLRGDGSPLGRSRHARAVGPARLLRRRLSMEGASRVRASVTRLDELPRVHVGLRALLASPLGRAHALDDVRRVRPFVDQLDVEIAGRRRSPMAVPAARRAALGWTRRPGQHRTRRACPEPPLVGWVVHEHEHGWAPTPHFRSSGRSRRCPFASTALSSDPSSLTGLGEPRQGFHPIRRTMHRWPRKEVMAANAGAAAASGSSSGPASMCAAVLLARVLHEYPDSRAPVHPRPPPQRPSLLLSASGDTPNGSPIAPAAPASRLSRGE